MSKTNDNGVVNISALEEDILTILLSKKEVYGLQILEIINEARIKRGITKLTIGSLYPTLGRLEKAKLVESKQVVSVFVRKFYELTPDGAMTIINVQKYRRLLAKQ